MWGVAFGSDMIHWFHHVPFSSDSMSSDLFFGSYRNGGLSFDSFRSDDTEDFPCVLNTIHGLTNGKFVAGGFFKRPPCSLCVQWSSRCWCSCGRLYETGKNTTNNAMTSARWLGGRNRPTSVCRTLVKCWQKIEWTRSKPDAWPAHVSLLLFVIYRCFFFRLFRFLTLHSVCGREGHRLWIFLWAEPFECRAICEAPARLNWSGG